MNIKECHVILDQSQRGISYVHLCKNTNKCILVSLKLPLLQIDKEYLVRKADEQAIKLNKRLALYDQVFIQQSILQVGCILTILTYSDRHFYRTFKLVECISSY